MLQPGWLPSRFGNQIGFFPQPLSEPAGGLFDSLGLLAAHRDDQFPSVGEILLKKFESLDDGLIRRQKIQHFDVEPQTVNTEADRNEQQKEDPAASVLH